MADVDDVMNFCGFKLRGKLKLKSVFTDGAKDFEGTSKLRRERASEMQRRGFVFTEIYDHQVTWQKHGVVTMRGVAWSPYHGRPVRRHHFVARTD